MSSGDFLTFEDAALVLGVSSRQAHRLAESGRITQITRGLVDRRSVDRFRASRAQGRTRSWAQHTAWGAIALLAGADADWLGPTQRSRLRNTLRHLTSAEELVTRCRDRATSDVFAAHRAAVPRLRKIVAVVDLQQLGIVEQTDSLDGYLPTDDVAAITRSHHLVADSSGNVVLRATSFDFATVRTLVDTKVVAGLDAATSLDPRVRGIGIRTVEEMLRSFR